MGNKQQQLQRVETNVSPDPVILTTTLLTSLSSAWYELISLICMCNKSNSTVKYSRSQKAENYRYIWKRSQQIYTNKFDIWKLECKQAILLDHEILLNQVTSYVLDIPLHNMQNPTLDRLALDASTRRGASGSHIIALLPVWTK